MTRIGEVAPRPIEELIPYLQEEAIVKVAEVSETLNAFDPPPFKTIPGFLTEEGLELLADLEVPRNGKCPEEHLLAHPVGGPLARTMGMISLSNMDIRFQSPHTAYSLKNESGQDLVLEPHRDLLDGHAVLFNYAVSGNLVYVLDGVRYELKENELVVLNGAAEWGDITGFLPGREEATDPDRGWRSLGGVTMAHAVVGSGFTSRNRLLVYADGRDTAVTQIPSQLPPWF